ncbi:MAG: 6-bladed beta-propeller [Candidatus Aminicenantes bacterium]|nr:MAG: 6-bladed beta-propeller [Candidatus Aminicenantes bacterium]
MKAILRIAVCGILIAVLSSSTGGKNIQTGEDVKIIQNKKKPDPPKGTPTKMILELETVIGESDDPGKAFSQLSSFVVEDDGTIYALDFKEQKIKVFDDSGEFLRAFGEKGQGPGELQMPAGVFLAPENRLAVNDALARKIVFYTKQGKYIDHVSYATRMQLTTLIMDSEGNFMGRELKLDGQEMFFEIVKMDAEMNTQFSLDKIGFAIPVPGSGTKINLMDMISIYQIDSDGNIYYGRNRDYEINVYTPEGKQAKSIRKQYQAQKITEEDKEEILGRMDSVASMSPINLREMFEFPKMFPPFQTFTLDEEDRIIVRTWEKGEEKDEFVHDIFDSEGRFIAQFTSKINVSVWKNGKAYAVDENEEGFYVIKKFSVRWDS